MLMNKINSILNTTYTNYTSKNVCESLQFYLDYINKPVMVADTDLTQEDLGEAKVVISAFGGGFKTDTVINNKAYEKYIEKLNGTDKKIITITYPNTPNPNDVWKSMFEVV